MSYPYIDFSNIKPALASFFTERAAVLDQGRAYSVEGMFGDATFLGYKWCEYSGRQRIRLAAMVAELVADRQVPWKRLDNPIKRRVNYMRTDNYRDFLKHYRNKIL